MFSKFNFDYIDFDLNTIYASNIDKNNIVALKNT